MIYEVPFSSRILSRKREGRRGCKERREVKREVMREVECVERREGERVKIRKGGKEGESYF